MSIWNLEQKQKLISEVLGAEIDYQTIEEMAELTQVLCKIRRAKGLGQPTQSNDKEIQAALYSELADVIVCLNELIHYHNIDEDALKSVMKHKIARTCYRLKIE